MYLEKLNNSIKTNFPIDYEFGDSFAFLGMKYNREPNEKLSIGDEVIIHPIPNVSQATKPYPVKIVSKEIDWAVKKDNGSFESVTKSELCLEGLYENSNWHGVVLNEYAFNRLEYVRRGILAIHF